MKITEICVILINWYTTNDLGMLSDQMKDTSQM